MSPVLGGVTTLALQNPPTLLWVRPQRLTDRPNSDASDVHRRMADFPHNADVPSLLVSGSQLAIGNS